MPVKSGYADRVFTTEMVFYPGMIHIDEKNDFIFVIQKAFELGEIGGLPRINNSETKSQQNSNREILYYAKMCSIGFFFDRFCSIAL